MFFSNRGMKLSSVEEVIQHKASQSMVSRSLSSLGQKYDVYLLLQLYLQVFPVGIGKPTG